MIRVRVYGRPATPDARYSHLGMLVFDALPRKGEDIDVPAGDASVLYTVDSVRHVPLTLGEQVEDFPPSARIHLHATECESD